MRHPEAYTAPADPIFRYLVWSEARFYFMDGLLTRLGECYKDPVVPDYTDASFELSPGILSGWNRVPGYLEAYMARESATDSPMPVLWSDSGVGFPVYDSITDMRGLVLSFPYHHVRLSDVAISVNVEEVNSAAVRMGERYPGFREEFEPLFTTIPEVALYGITAEQKRVFLLGCRENQLEPIRRRSIVGDAAAETYIGLYLSLEQGAHGVPLTIETPFTPAALIIKKIEVYGNSVPVAPACPNVRVDTCIGQDDQTGEYDHLGIGKWR